MRTTKRDQSCLWAKQCDPSFRAVIKALELGEEVVLLINGSRSVWARMDDVKDGHPAMGLKIVDDKSVWSTLVLGESCEINIDDNIGDYLFKSIIKRIKVRLDIKPGDIYESCAYHPVLCIGVDYEDDDIWGISLIDGTYPHNCSLIHCGVRKLSIAEAWLIRTDGPLDPDVKASYPSEDRWWQLKDE